MNQSYFNLLFLIVIISILFFIFYNCIKYTKKETERLNKIEKKIEQGLL